MNEAVIRFLERPGVYLAWQRPFVAMKLGPAKRHNDLSKVRRVLDVGCGPGTNAAEFPGAEYLGVDVNPAYVEYARRRHARRFEVVDVRSDPIPARGTYDFVLVNSLLHHLDESSAAELLETLRDCVSDDGHLHSIEVVLPEERGLPRLLALSDRGDYTRSVEAWRKLFSHSFDEVVLEPFRVPSRGPALWVMVYFKGSPKRL